MTRKQLELFSVDDMYGCIGVDDEICAISVAAYSWTIRIVSDLDDEMFRKVKHTFIIITKLIVGLMYPMLIRLLWQEKRLRAGLERTHGGDRRDGKVGGRNNTADEVDEIVKNSLSCYSFEC